jgi:hypothetical protein
VLSAQVWEHLISPGPTQQNSSQRTYYRGLLCEPSVFIRRACVLSLTSIGSSAPFCVVSSVRVPKAYDFHLRPTIVGDPSKRRHLDWISSWSYTHGISFITAVHLNYVRETNRDGMALDNK